MTINYKDGKVTFEIYEILQCLDTKQKFDMMESFACDDVIIKHVTDQILDCWTENMCSGGVSYPAQHNPTHGLGWAWREVAKRSGEVAAREIERLEKALEYEKERTQEALEEIRKLRDSYNRCYG